MALAENLGWSLKGLREAFGEVLREGLAKADFKARVIMVPNALKYDRPESPNVLKFWAKCFDEIPECDLKNEYFQIIKDFTEGLGEGFKEAFREAFKEPFKESITITITNTITNTINNIVESRKENSEDKGFFLASLLLNLIIKKKPKI
ncbi:MAG: hypothetical protein K6T73_01290 [Candidatus Bathyarchaeota archaeon]|nr:hypothetical protein [Candidatus Bathyarchaeota archaeon]